MLKLLFIFSTMIYLNASTLQEWEKFGYREIDYNECKKGNISLEEINELSLSNINCFAANDFRQIDKSISTEDIVHSRKYGVSAYNFKKLKKDGLSNKEILDWGKVYYSVQHSTSMFANEVKKWIKFGITPSDAKSYMINKVFSSDDLRNWFKLGIKDPNEIYRWYKIECISPRSVNSWYKLGIKDINKAEELYILGINSGTYEKWKEFGITNIEDIKKLRSKEIYWHTFNDLRRKGITDLKELL